MKARPILFNTDMVKAILAGHKTQTRRAVNAYMAANFDEPRGAEDVLAGYPFVETEGGYVSALKLCPYGQPGDLLYVRETWNEGWSYGGSDSVVFYRATGDGWIGSEVHPPADVMNGQFGVSSGQTACSAPKSIKWKPSIHMPRWASRLTLEITDVRVERLQDISEEDARSEGIQSKPGIAVIEGKQTPSPVYFVGGLHPEGSPSEAFRSLWSSIYSNWHTNPWVWVVEFKVHHCNVDALLREREEN